MQIGLPVEGIDVLWISTAVESISTPPKEHIFQEQTSGHLLTFGVCSPRPSLGQLL